MNRLPAYCATPVPKKKCIKKEKAAGIVRVYKMVDTCSAEFEAKNTLFLQYFRKLSSVIFLL